MDKEAVFSLAQSVCYEFCDDIIIDPENGSILLYIPKKFYAPVCNRLTKLDFVEIFKQKRRKYIVCCLQLLHDDLEETEIYYDEDDDEDDDD